MHPCFGIFGCSCLGRISSVCVVTYWAECSVAIFSSSCWKWIIISKRIFRMSKSLLVTGGNPGIVSWSPLYLYMSVRIFSEVCDKSIMFTPLFPPPASVSKYQRGIRINVYPPLSSAGKSMESCPASFRASVKAVLASLIDMESAIQESSSCFFTPIHFLIARISFGCTSAI